MNNSVKNIFFTVVALSPLFYLLIIWNKIPAVVPTHFDLKGPNEYGAKTSIMFFSLFFSAVTVGAYSLLQNIHKIDPKRSAKPQSPVFNKLAIGTVIFLTALNFFIILMTAQAIHLTRFIIPLVGLFFSYMGYVMRDIQPNYFAGIRLPWTLHSDYNWYKTHKLVGKVWGITGLLLAAIAIVIPVEKDLILMPVFVVVVIAVPVIYSFRLYKKEQADPAIALKDPDYKAHN